MYEPRKPRIRRPLKGRSPKYVSAKLPSKSLWQSRGWMSLITVGTTIVPPRVVPRIFTYIKKLIKYPKTRSRFWVNAQCSFLVTRKPLNVRMGKGKGAKVRFYTKINHGSPLAAFSTLRDGLKKRLVRFVSIRLGRRALLVEPSLSSSSVEWAQRHRTQINFLKGRAGEIKDLLTFVRRPSLKFFFGKLFRAAWRKPRLRWRYRWPLLPKVSSKLKSRKKKWGTGLKRVAPIWAGLASLFSGVRRVKVKPVKLKRKALGSAKRAVFRKLLNFLPPQALRVAKEAKKGGGLRKKPRLSFLKLLSKAHKLRLYPIKKLIRSKNKTFFKLLRIRSLRGVRTTYPKSKITMPLGGGLGPLRASWSKLFLSFSHRENSALLSLGTPSLTCLVKTIGLLERVSLLVSSTSLFLKDTNKAYVGESLFLLKENRGGSEGGVKVIGGSSLVLDYTVGGGYIDLWPRLDLRPLILTKATLSPLLPLFS